MKSFDANQYPELKYLTSPRNSAFIMCKRSDFHQVRKRLLAYGHNNSTIARSERGSKDVEMEMIMVDVFAN